MPDRAPDQVCPWRRAVEFVAGNAEAEAFASIEQGGDGFPGSDVRTVQVR